MIDVHSIVGNRYRVVQSLGTGGMGAVYLVEDTLLNNQRVALKLLHPHFRQDDAHVQRFLREVELTRTLNSPHVIRTFDVGFHGNSMFFTMELLEGETLEQKIAGARLTEVEAITYFCGICIGLAAIHSNGVVHRDLKPANIVVDGAGLVKLMDFGLARPSDSKLTADHSNLGTAAYMAPELWKGEQATEQSDLYALGVLGYELFTGKPPFEGSSSAALMYAHLHEEPPPILAGSSSISGAVSVVIGQLLRKDPAKRPESANEVLNMLAASAPNLSLPAHSVAIFTTGSRRLGKRPLALGAAIATFALLAAALLANALSGRRAGQESPGAAVATPFQPPPSFFNQALLWLDAGTIVATPGERVATWESKGLLQRTLTQPDPARQPSLVANASGGLPALEFDGHSQMMYSNQVADDLRNVVEMSVLFVGRIWSGPPQQFVYALQLPDRSTVVTRLGFAQNQRLLLNLSSERADLDFHSEPLPQLSQFAVYSATLSRESARIYRNGKEMLIVPIRKPLRYNDTFQFYLGAEADPGPRGSTILSDFLAGQLSEFVLLSRHLPDAERLEAERYLSTKYNVTTEVPR